MKTPYEVMDDNAFAKHASKLVRFDVDLRASSPNNKDNILPDDNDLENPLNRESFM